MMRTLVGAVVAVAGLLPAPAGATPLCVTVAGTLPPLIVGPVCAPFSGSVTCTTTTLNGGVTSLHVSYCQPR